MSNEIKLERKTIQLIKNIPQFAKLANRISIDNRSNENIWGIFTSTLAKDLAFKEVFLELLNLENRIDITEFDICLLRNLAFITKHDKYF